MYKFKTTSKKQLFGHNLVWKAVSDLRFSIDLLQWVFLWKNTITYFWPKVFVDTMKNTKKTLNSHENLNDISFFDNHFILSSIYINVLYLNNFFSNLEKLNPHILRSASLRKKQSFIYLVNVYVHNIYGIKLISSFQAILVSLWHHRVPFVVLQTPLLNTIYWQITGYWSINAIYIKLKTDKIFDWIFSFKK